jgi:hypothetical protein
MGRSSVSNGGRLAWLERAAIGMTPVVALAVVALGLRSGAGERIRGALVYARGPGHGRTALAWQLVVVAEEGGVREVVPGATVDVEASLRGARATWHGVTNAEGVAEVGLDLPGVKWGDPVALRATASDGAVLADGSVMWPPEGPPVDAHEEAIHPTRATGELAIEVLLRGGKLVPGASETALVRVTNAATRAPLDDVALTFTPEPGLVVAPTEARTANGGRSEVQVSAEFLLAGWIVEAKAPSADGAEAKSGSWYGALPVAPGGASVKLPEVIPAHTPYPLTFEVPPATKHLYVEIDDAWGRDFGAAIDATASRAEATLPRLAPGHYWLVTSSDARGAEALSGTTLARPFDVGEPKPVTALRSAEPFSRFLAVDGLVRPIAAAAARRRRAVWVVLTALVVAAMLEVLLLLRAAERARRKLATLSDATTEAGADGRELGPRQAGGVAILVLVTILGFALIAALMMVRN